MFGFQWGPEILAAIVRVQRAEHFVFDVVVLLTGS